MRTSLLQALARVLISLLSAFLLPASVAQAGAPAPVNELEANVLVLEVVLDGHLLSDSFSAYQDGPQILVPLGELARLLSLGITVDADHGLASGFVVRESNPFALRVDDATVTLGDRSASVEPRLVRVLADDVLVSTQLLARWLPLDIEVDLPTLQLRIKPRVRLPMQDRLDREKAASRLRKNNPAQDVANLPLASSTSDGLGAPFIDQTLGGDARLGRGASQYKAAYTAYITSDVMGLEGEAYVTSSQEDPTPQVRWSLGKHDPEGHMLGLLHARQIRLGNVLVPSIPHVMLGNPSGQGAMISNRPMNQPTSFDRHTLKGDLPPGWDVTLYYNDALAGYQGAAINGQYLFEDLPLSYGANEFRLVFNGPVGQVRVERQSFLLDQSTLKPGELHYALAHQLSDGGALAGSRTTAQVDLGVTESLAVNGAVVDMPEAPGRSGRYIQGGLRYYLGDTISSLQLYGSGHGWLAEAGIKARIGTYALELTHTQRQSDFVSSVYNTAGSGLKMRDALRLTGGLRVPGLPMVSLSVEGHRDANWSGQVEAAMSGRASTMVLGTSLSNTLRWSYSAVYRGVDGSFQLSRRIMNVGVSAQMDYAVRPNPQVHALSLTADRTLGSGFRINGGIVHTPEASQTIVSGAVSKNMGAYSVAVSGSYSSEHETVLGMQLFMALGKDPRKGQWMADSQPMAGAGAVSARAFLDKNSNGVRDADEQLIAGAAFVINRGGRYPVRTDANGTVFMSRLPTGQYVDVALDAGTLEDPQWTSSVPGWRVLSRPGRVELLEFPVVPCSEIEGTVYLLHKGARRPIGDTRLEMLDEHQRVVARTTSSGDGYFLMHQVPPGRLVLRVDPEQAAKLNLQGNLQREIVAPPEGDFISGQDIELVKP